MAELKIINMEDVEREDVSWFMKPYLPFGKITIVQGDPGCGKTSMMLELIVIFGIWKCRQSYTQSGNRDIIEQKGVQLYEKCLQIQV